MAEQESRECRTCSVEKYVSAYYYLSNRGRYSYECKACTQSKASAAGKARRKNNVRAPRGWYALDETTQKKILAGVEGGKSYKVVAEEVGTTVPKLYGYLNAGHIPRAQIAKKNQPDDGVVSV